MGDTRMKKLITAYLLACLALSLAVGAMAEHHYGTGASPEFIADAHNQGAASTGHKKLSDAGEYRMEQRQTADVQVNVRAVSEPGGYFTFLPIVVEGEWYQYYLQYSIPGMNFVTEMKGKVFAWLNGDEEGIWGIRYDNYPGNVENSRVAFFPSSLITAIDPGEWITFGKAPDWTATDHLGNTVYVLLEGTVSLTYPTPD